MGLADKVSVRGLVVLLQHEGSVVVLSGVDNALLQCLIQLAPCDRGRNCAAGLPEILLDLGRLGADGHALQIIRGLDGLLAVVVTDGRGPVAHDAEAVAGLRKDSLLHLVAEVAVKALLPVIEALENVVQREEVNFRNTDGGHEARRRNDQVSCAHGELLDQLGLVLAQGPLVDRCSCLAAGDLFQSGLESFHTDGVGVLFRSLVGCDDQVQLCRCRSRCIRLGLCRSCRCRSCCRCRGRCRLGAAAGRKAHRRKNARHHNCKSLFHVFPPYKITISLCFSCRRFCRGKPMFSERPDLFPLLIDDRDPVLQIVSAGRELNFSGIEYLPALTDGF